MIAFLLILLILSMVIEVISLNTSFQNISFEFETDRRSTEPGEPFYIVHKVSNTSWLPVTFLRTKILFPRGTVTSKDAAVIMNSFERKSSQHYFLLPRRRLIRRVPAVLGERGLYWFENAEMERGDFLGLKTNFTHVWGYSGIIVRPEKLKDSRSVETLSGIVGDFLSKPFLMRDPVLTVGVREYTGTEPMKTISWKKSASRGKLMVREFDYTRERSCTIVVTGSVDASDSQMDMCARIARTAGEMLMEQGVQLRFFTSAYLQASRPFEVYKSEASRASDDVFLNQLACLRPGAVAPASKLLDEIGSRSASQCILIAPFEEPGVYELQRKISALTRSETAVILADDFQEVRG
jgi:uncharacterized protein (DUF58 family)